MPPMTRNMSYPILPVTHNYSLLSQPQLSTGFDQYLCLWNSLPVALRDRDISLVQFKRLFKTLWFV